MIDVTIKLPVGTFIKHDGEQRIVVDWSKIPASVISQVCETGAKTMLINVWNGGGKDVPDAERAAAVRKKLDAWERGEINIRERGGSLESAMFEAYRAEIETALGKMTDAAWAKFRLDTVKQDKGAVRWEPFITARATTLAKRKEEKRPVEDIANALTERFETAAQAILAERSKAVDSLDLTGLDF